jgi:hypothetical protein
MEIYSMTRRKSLTLDQIRAIRQEYKPGKRGFGYASLARKYGVGESTIRDHVNFYVGYSLK